MGQASRIEERGAVAGSPFGGAAAPPRAETGSGAPHGALGNLGDLLQPDAPDVAFSYRRGLRHSTWTYAAVASAAYRFARELDVNYPFRISKGSIGEVIPGQEVRVDEGGEILVRGANVTPGYWGMPTGAAREDGGWFRTGDIGAMDASGRLYFTGRKKDVIVTAAGLKVYPEDLEAALDRQPEVVASAVVGLDGPVGPEPVAALILRSPAADAAAAVERANGSLAEHQRMRRWVVWPEPDFPRTPTQKVRKPIVADHVRGHAHGQPPATGQSPLAELVARAGGEVPAAVEPTARLGADLKLDSLALGALSLPRRRRAGEFESEERR
jgi:long-chain acyl-CoA synthetase